MKTRTIWGFQSFLLCFFFNLAFTAAIFFMAGKILDALNEWVSALNGAGVPSLPEEVRMALGSLVTLVVQVREYMLIVLAALASAFTLLMWFFLFLAGGRLIRRAAEMVGLYHKSESETDQAKSMPD